MNEKAPVETPGLFVVLNTTDFVYDNSMLITFDETKRQTNLIKHGLDFADLTLQFFEAAVVFEAAQDRFKALGEFAGELVVAVVFKPLGTEALTIISMRPASRKERSLL